MGQGKKSHGTLIDWRTGREWPVNCMTVISAWWRSNMPFQRLSGRLTYNITRWRQLERRCWNENMSQRGWAPGRAVQEDENDTRRCPDGLAGGEVNVLQSLFSLQLPLTCNLTSLVFIFVCRYDTACIRHIYIYIYIYILHVYMHIYYVSIQHLGCHSTPVSQLYIYIYLFLNFHHTTCESTCYTISSSAAIQGW